MLGLFVIKLELEKGSSSQSQVGQLKLCSSLSLLDLKFKLELELGRAYPGSDFLALAVFSVGRCSLSQTTALQVQSYRFFSSRGRPLVIFTTIFFLLQVNTSLTAARARLHNTREERDQFDEASNQLVQHLKAKV